MSPYKMQDWVNEILPDGASLSEESAAMIERVFTATATSFGEQGMEFEPLLPDDEQPLNGRANALALWCTGFLYGLGTGHISDLEALNGDVGEIVRDFTEISRATGDDADADESNEQAYAELVEFIRVAAQVVFEELLPLRSQAYPAAAAAALMDRKEFARRRRQFMRMIGKDASRSCRPPGAPSQRRHRVRLPAGQPFLLPERIPEPDAVAVLVPGRAAGRVPAVRARARRAARVWDGARAGPTARSSATARTMPFRSPTSTRSCPA
jgi:uncharacterized protein